MVTATLGRPQPAAACVPAGGTFGACSESYLPPIEPGPTPPQEVCPNDVDHPGDPNRCLHWAQPRYCVGSIVGLPPPSQMCQFRFNTIQEAIDAAAAHETILVGTTRSTCVGGGPCPPVPVPVFTGALTIDSPVCLRAHEPDFWQPSSTTDDWRYPAVIRTGPSDAVGIDIEAGGSGSCIQGFKVDHRGTVADTTAIRVGISTSSGRANYVTLVHNFIDHSQAGAMGVHTGIRAAGKHNNIVANVLLGKQNTVDTNVDHSRGVYFHWTADNGVCSDWDNNLIAANQLSRFERGTEWRKDAPGACADPPGRWTGNRVVLNDISECGAGIITMAGAPGMRFIIMNNRVSEGRVFTTATQSCEPDTASQGIVLGDADYTEIAENDITGVQIGIHLSYTSCYARIRENKVHARGRPGLEPIPPRGIFICPSHCNWLVDNQLSSDDPLTGVGIDFTNRQEACYGAKPVGTYYLDGGLIHDVKCITTKRPLADFNVLRSPGRQLAPPSYAINCP